MDLYSLLGLARTASLAEIERAYRRLARLYHPGVNPGDRVSQERYRQVQEAYVVLSDVNRRREYDHGPAPAPDKRPDPVVAFEGFDFSAVADGPLAATFSELFSDVFRQAAEEAIAPTRGADIELVAHVSFVDAVQGADVPLSLTRQERCPGCHGRGRVSRAAMTCPACGGATTRRRARGHLVFTKACETCEGTGRLDFETCRTCAGIGTAARTEVVTVHVPAGIDSGARIAVPGRGHAGARGGPAGDLYVHVEVAPHPHFRRVGRDIHLTLPVAIHEAALGARVDVPTLNGSAKLRIPPGTTSGQQFRLLERGVGADGGRGADAAGDLVVDIQVVLPEVIDDASKELLREFGRLNGADVRRHLFDHA
jgi:molecular chaperone DnaJ